MSSVLLSRDVDIQGDDSSKYREAFKPHFEVLFDVVDFLQRYVSDGSETDLLCEPADILSLRRTFAAAPEALEAALALFENRMEFTARDESKAGSSTRDEHRHSCRVSTR